MVKDKFVHYFAQGEEIFQTIPEKIWAPFIHHFSFGEKGKTM